MTYAIEIPKKLLVAIWKRKQLGVTPSIKDFVIAAVELHVDGTPIDEEALVFAGIRVRE